MACILSFSARALATVSVTSFAVAALSWAGDALRGAAREDLQLEPLIRALGDVVPATSVPIVFKATNTSSRPIRVVGVKNICTPWGCLSAENLPCVVPAHASSDVRLSLKTTDRSHVGSLVFDGEIVLYSDSASNEIIPARVSGRVVQADLEN
jgi:hypothetical protein